MCGNRGCCYSKIFGCYHYYPSRYQYTRSMDDPEINGESNPLRSMTTLGETSVKLQFSLTEMSEDRLKIDLAMSPDILKV